MGHPVFMLTVELTWLQPQCHVHCLFAVMSQMEEVRLTASYAQGQHGISRVERKPAHSYTTLH
jgi:hypothetical protein